MIAYVSVHMREFFVGRRKKPSELRHEKNSRNIATAGGSHYFLGGSGGSGGKEPKVDGPFPWPKGEPGHCMEVFTTLFT